MRLFFLLPAKYTYIIWLFPVFIILFSLGTANSKFIPDVRIEHTPPATVSQGQRIHLDARIAGSERLTEVRCYFKYEAANPYLFVKMKQTEQGFECWLPVPASHVDRVEYVFVAVDSFSQTVRSRVFYASITGLPKVSATPPVVMQQGIVPVKSEFPISYQTATAFAQTDQPVYSIVAANKQYGARAGIYDSTQEPGYRYGLFGGLVLGLNAQYLSPTLGYQSFVAVVSSEVQVLLEQEVVLATYPDINGSDWSGYFYVVDNNGNLLSGKSPLTATVYHDGNGGVSIAISTGKCPGRDYYGKGDMDTSGFIHIYDYCDDELWTTYWVNATSTRIQIMDFIDPPYYKKLNVVDITRSDPHPIPPAPTLVSPPIGAVTDSRETVLQWNAAAYAVNYQVQLGSSCTTGTLYQTPSLQYALTDFEPDNMYYWQVRGQNSVGLWGPWSSCWNFTTRASCPACPAINLLLLGN
ncbi:hypothetical protein JWG42_01775 [Desulfoprunum benzoelyticum]|uniref:Fibronectin type-III domain-containing protein n=1 Tax=Desulfoprunum benzoelyticum TaxID=1506996 RepID=A0A840V045_9BACT|nr:hypothetical protein [Desulfoprunum benzoelyticum]MBB5346591.1 hypothetical protein [Desulfoprunum benzoelyticum]MBM9528880.1 hypothetical protein [Desulfoprunum benzoelyticum]